MKKVIMTAAFAIAAFAQANAGSAVSVNTMVVAVPEILSITANPSWQGHTMTEGELDGPTDLTTAEYTIKSNAYFTATSNISVDFVPTNTGTGSEVADSKHQFIHALEFSLDGHNYISLEAMNASGFNPLTQSGAHTTSTGVGYSLHTRVNSLGWGAIPGTYTTTATVTVTQP